MPPQTSSRRAASMWLCAAHNKVNARLGKEEFACDHLEEHYDCGCGDEGGANATAVVGPELPPTKVGPTATAAVGVKVRDHDTQGGFEALLARGAGAESCMCAWA